MLQTRSFEPRTKRSSGYFPREAFSDIVPVRRYSRGDIGPSSLRIGLARLIGSEIVPRRRPTLPPAGYRVAVAVLALPKASAADSFELRFVDPRG